MLRGAIYCLLSACAIQVLGQSSSSGYSLEFDGSSWAKLEITECGGDGTDVTIAENVTLMSWVKLHKFGDVSIQFVVGAGAAEAGPKLLIKDDTAQGEFVPFTEDLWDLNNPSTNCVGSNLTHIHGALRSSPLLGLKIGHWHHIAVSYDSDTHSIYMDGVLYRHCVRKGGSVWRSGLQHEFVFAKTVNLGMYDTSPSSANQKAFTGELDEVNPHHPARRRHYPAIFAFPLVLIMILYIPIAHPSYYPLNIIHAPGQNIQQTVGACRDREYVQSIASNLRDRCYVSPHVP
jgi:hypothetical protein